jgi:hypothetical protein
VYFGGPLELMTAELLVLLYNDLFLVFLSVVFVGCYMRAYFGQWRLAGLAALQILLSFPFMYFVVCVIFFESTLSAFAAASLAVVVGVSADNIFVLHETWAQSRMLMNRRGQPASEEERIEWTVRQASVPLFYANATTAASLYINCLSEIKSVYQFGLCGGTLIFINFGLCGVYLPALLLLRELPLALLLDLLPSTHRARAARRTQPSLARGACEPSWADKPSWAADVRWCSMHLTWFTLRMRGVRGLIRPSEGLCDRARWREPPIGRMRARAAGRRAT